jgi:hypothetical protein
VIQTVTTPSATYWLKESIRSVSRSTPSSPPVNAIYTQRGFYVVESSVKPTGIRRALSQYLMSDPFLKKLRAAPALPRLTLGFEHERRWFSTKWPFGLEVPILLETTPTNAAPHVPGHPIPPPLAALHMPSVTPAFPAGEATPTWPATIGAVLGFAQFLLDYTVAWSTVATEAPVAEITFADQTKSFSQDEFTLSLKPVGGWKTTFRAPDLFPTASAGKFQYLVMGSQGQRPPAEILNLHVEFEWKLVPVAFVDDRVVTQAWNSLPQ